MATNKVNPQDKEVLRQESIEATVSKTDQFFKENSKTIWGAVIAVAVVGLAVLGYSKFIYQPKCEEAMQQAFPAEANFQAGDFELALNGDGNVLGLADVIDNYGAKAGRSVYLSAGICELQLGNYDSALSYLKKYKGKDVILAARAMSLQGDAYVGLENYDAAVKAYEAAAAKSDNLFAASYLVKAGMVYEKLGNNAKALECYQTVRNNYGRSVEGYDIEMYINRVK